MSADAQAAEAPAQSRRARRCRGLASAIIGVAAVALLVWVAPPGEVIEEIGHMSPVWVLAAIGLELCSCLSYVIVFRLFFPEPPRATSRQVAWIAMGAGAVLPGGNLSSAAATGLLLRRSGLGTRSLIERCAALLCLLTAFGFLVNGLAGGWLLLGIPGGPHDLRHTGGPILVSVAVLSTAAVVLVVARRLGPRAPKPLRGLGAGLDGAWRQAGSRHWRLLGAVGFFCFDLAALWAACAATGHPLGLPAVAIAYCIGYLATAIPMPAGLGVLDSGLATALVLYGMPPVASVGAVLVYHAIAIWVPGLGGLLAWLPTRRSVAARPPAGLAVPRLTPVADQAPAALAVPSLTPVADQAPAALAVPRLTPVADES